MAARSLAQQQADLLSGVGYDCQSIDLEILHRYTARPDGESLFPLAPDRVYERVLYRCNACMHTISVHTMLSDPAMLYNADYVSSTYGDAAGLMRNFKRITSLPEGTSDNRCRADRVDTFCRSSQSDHALLDVGSGLAVFVYEMARRGWVCTALDTDRRLTQHAEKVAPVATITGDFFCATDLGMYNLITFNKVLEHVTRPIDFLIKARQHLRPGGVLYIEVPDGIAAATVGYGREEFFIEHLHVFSEESLKHMISCAGLAIESLHSIVEPSGKYTLFAFARAL
jgi:2-polyprenyl-3-methyl-5-hydroxy-6-metoxy-1,4-benzoquinol methylase